MDAEIAKIIIASSGGVVGIGLWGIKAALSGQINRSIGWEVRNMAPWVAAGVLGGALIGDAMTRPSPHAISPLYGVPISALPQH